jgi:SdrD B-like domain
MKKLLLISFLISIFTVLGAAQTKTSATDAKSPGGPIPGVGVNLGRKPGGQVQKTIYTDAGGNFEFSNLEAGKYTLKLVAPEKSSTIVSPRDAASGLATGKRMHQPVAIKEQDTKSDTRVVKAEIVIEGDDDKPATTEKKNIANSEKPVSPKTVTDILLTIEVAKQNTQKGPINTSRSNIRTNMVTLLNEGVEVEVGADGALKGTVLKTKHDTVKNSIGNVR